jgi:hypothetical protein
MQVLSGPHQCNAQQEVNTLATPLLEYAQEQTIYAALLHPLLQLGAAPAAASWATLQCRESAPQLPLHLATHQVEVGHGLVEEACVAGLIAAHEREDLGNHGVGGLQAAPKLLQAADAAADAQEAR